MLHALIDLACTLFLAVLAVFLFGVLVLTVVTVVKSIKKELKGGKKDDHNPKP